MKNHRPQKHWTDYPIAELGDTPGEKAPMREVRIISYDGNKYCKIEAEGKIVEIKAGYVYDQPK